MTVKEVIESVRRAMDEEAGYSDYETEYADRIIRSRMCDALRWVLERCSGSLLVGGSCGSVVTEAVSPSGGVVNLPSGFLRLIRVRAGTWQKSVCVAVSDDSAEYLMQSDAVARADYTRPVAAFVCTTPPRLELFPHPSSGESVELTYAVVPAVEEGDTSDVGVPQKAEGAYIYFLAYLVALAWGDARAEGFLSTAIMLGGVTTGGK